MFQARGPCRHVFVVPITTELTVNQAVLIDIDALRVGMFIQLELGWINHPFPMSSFRLSSPDQIRVLREIGLQSVRYIPAKSTVTAANAGLRSEGAGMSLRAMPWSKRSWVLPICWRNSMRASSTAIFGFKRPLAPMHQSQPMCALNRRRRASRQALIRTCSARLNVAWEQ